MSKKKENSFLMQGAILAATALITKIIGLAYRIPVTNIIGSRRKWILRNGISSVQSGTDVNFLQSADCRIQIGICKSGYRTVPQCIPRFPWSNDICDHSRWYCYCNRILWSRIHCDRYYEDGSVRLCTPCTGTMYFWLLHFLVYSVGSSRASEPMIPTAVSQTVEQIINAIVSIVGAYMLLKVGQNSVSGADKKSYGAAYAAAGATLGTVAGALAALVFLILLFCVFRKGFKKQMKHDTEHRTESGKHIAKVLLFTIAPVILSATVYNISNLLDQAVFTNAMAAQGMPKKEYTELLGMFSGQYDTITNIPLSVASALAASFMPSLVATIQTGSRKEIHNKIDLVSRFNMIIAIPCAAAFITLGKPILDLLYFTQDNTIPAMLLKIGGISVVFFCLSTVTNAALQGMDHMSQPVKNAAISLVIHLVALYIMLVAFHWNIYSIVASKIIFAAAICVLNDRDLRKCSGYVQEYRKTFIIPGISAIIMSIVALGVHLVFELFAGPHIATVIAVLVAIAVYFVALILLKGVTEAEIKTLPMGTKDCWSFQKAAFASIGYCIR